MKRILIGLTVALAGVAVSMVTIGARPSFIQQIPKESKDQPTQVKLDSDSLDDKWGEVKFDHETHSTRKYNPDGASMTACTVCHHTDQPKAQLKPPFTTSERDVVLTADVLKDAAAKPVKTCRQCHLQAGDDSKPLPETPGDDGKSKKWDNENAYHQNCFDCHDKAIQARPELAQKISGKDSKGCGKCHAAK